MSRILAILSAFALLGLLASFSVSGGPAGLRIPTDPEIQPSDLSAHSAQVVRSCVVRRIIDGDTFVCADEERVRLILVNTPEMDQEPLGPLARNFLLGVMPPGTEIQLEIGMEARDRYGRLLAYAILPDGRMVNRVLARRGYAQTMVIPPNVKHVEAIRAAVDSARAESAGLWRVDVGAAEEVGSGRAGVPGRDRVREDVGDGGGICHPSYPDICIPPLPPDLDCGDIDARRFRVTGSDPHRFDGGGDGLGCEGAPGR